MGLISAGPLRRGVTTQAKCRVTAANQEQRIRVLEAAVAERQMAAEPAFSKLGLGAALGLLGLGLFDKPQT